MIMMHNKHQKGDHFMDDDDMMNDPEFAQMQRRNGSQSKIRPILFFGSWSLVIGIILLLWNFGPKFRELATGQ